MTKQNYYNQAEEARNEDATMRRFCCTQWVKKRTMLRQRSALQDVTIWVKVWIRMNRCLPIFIVLILFSCKDTRTTVPVGDSTKDDSTVIEDSLSEYVEINDTLVDSIAIRIYTPLYSSVHLYCGSEIPDGTCKKHLYCAAAAFTGTGYEKGFSHNIVAGDHVSQGKRYKGYICTRNTGAFVYYNGRFKFLYKNYSEELDSAAQNKGMGFAQEMMIHNGKKVQTTRQNDNTNQFRVLCKKGKDLCLIESGGPVTFGQFIDCLLKINVTEALYLDMGGWSYSWYRDKEGNVVRPFPGSREVLSNAIVFEGPN